MSVPCIVCHYGEIGLKGKNLGNFERILLQNIKKALEKQKIPFDKIYITNKRIVILIDKIHNKNTGKIIKNIPGISYFCFALKCKTELDELKNTALELIKKTDTDIKKQSAQTTFRITTQRSNKKFELTSHQINEKIGEFIIEKLHKKVKLKNPDIGCFIEVVDEFSYVYIKKQRGVGGLPVGSSGRVVSLLSGGIDSPVSSFFMMKRGARVVFVTFYVQNLANHTTLIEKVKKIVKVLNKFQTESKIYFVPFDEIQKAIFEKTQSISAEKQRIIIYRRFMMRIAQKIAKKENAKALVTGDSLGQVASQTLENIAVINAAIKYPIFRPLLGFDKEEIIALAKKIDTFELSIKSCQDVCSRFLPKNPTTKSKIEVVKRIEKKMSVIKLINNALKKAKVFNI